MTTEDETRMHKLAEVEEAKVLMNEAMDWSVFRWLFEKHRVRETADRANAVLDKTNRALKTRWPDNLKAAYKELTGRHQNGSTNGIDPQIRLFVEKMKEADDAAHRARMTAEATFDEAERQLNTELAREGCRQAIHSWKLHEKAIRIAEGVPACIIARP